MERKTFPFFPPTILITCEKNYRNCNDLTAVGVTQAADSSQVQRNSIQKLYRSFQPYIAVIPKVYAARMRTLIGFPENFGVLICDTFKAASPKQLK